jgi:nucleotide-binding universal stress UspA family protein
MTVVAAVDDSQHARRVVAEAAKLADAFGTELHLVHVLSRNRFVELERTSVSETGEAIEVNRIREIAAEIAAEAAADVDRAYETVGLVGDAAPRVVDYAADHDAEYIVVGGRKRSPVGKAIFSSVTQSVLLDAPVPVLAVMKERT